METNKENAIEEKKSTRKSLWITVIAFFILLLFLVIVGWGLKRAQQGSITIGDRVPPFSFVSFDGEQINTEDYAGKVVVANFWSSWCTPCEQEAADLETAWNMYKSSDEVIFLGVAYVDTEPESLGYIEKFNISYPNGPDLRTSISQMFRIRGVPETYIIGKDGRLAYVKIGPFMSLSEIQSAIDPLLQ